MMKIDDDDCNYYDENIDRSYCYFSSLFAELNLKISCSKILLVFYCICYQICSLSDSSRECYTPDIQPSVFISFMCYFIYFYISFIGYVR